MNINATLLVQMVHFLIAYGALRYFLLRPLVALIMQDRAYQKKLEDIILEEERIRVHKQEQQVRQWHMFQRSWLQKIPAVRYYQEKKYPELQIQKMLLNADKMRLYSVWATQQIKERVDNVI